MSLPPPPTRCSSRRCHGGEETKGPKRRVCYNFLTSFPFSLSILFSLSPPVESPFLYLSFPSELSDTHAFPLLLAQPCAFLLFNKHSLKAMHFFTIKYFQVGYLFPSLDLNVL